MRFTVLHEGEDLRDGGPGCFLAPALVPGTPGDKYRTLYRLWFRDAAEAVCELGLVKIGYADLIRDKWPLEVGNFTSLGPGYDQRLYWFSVGQNDSYYDNIRALGPVLRAEILDVLCDIAYDEESFDQAMMWDVTHASLLHAVAPQTVGVQFRRIARGGMRFTDYDFSYVAPARPSEEAASEPWQLFFSVQPHSSPPTNVHVLIGRNGVGKTTLLGNLTSAVVSPGARSASGYRPSPNRSSACCSVNIGPGRRFVFIPHGMEPGEFFVADVVPGRSQPCGRGHQHGMSIQGVLDSKVVSP